MSSTELTATVDSPFGVEGATLTVRIDTHEEKYATACMKYLVQAASPDSHTGKAKRLNRADFRDLYLEPVSAPTKDIWQFRKSLKSKENFIDQEQLVFMYNPENGRLIVQSSIKEDPLYDKKGVWTYYHLKDIMEVIVDGR